ncbi:phenazine biosynthesis-like domain-containing protein [Penaeus japonicus]|uniref:phenazine biosynthesis-like domain-containing protein n=1 Tax=Penaeus japonicus TaxID=27405 RepID=UPI001C711F17|nr:phenazine biosynthesis-like domain-containing protein [Penaeus japonicus]XP_042862253.1 phenazine biosynthesis-like domain-containing protein [Penaeus japonicus]XP_042862254.1 phenazine biosynthesis-like domain-containing protein [Penaeus japonicus]
MRLQIFTVDAFTDQAFSGNPAAVVPLLEPLEEQTLQKLASELNLSETAYVSPIGDDIEPWVTSSQFNLRWFTPTNEVPLCGHATLATAHTLFSSLGNKSSRIEFKTKSGLLVARKDGSNIILDFPANPPEPLTAEQRTDLDVLVKGVVNDLLVDTVLLSHTTKKLLVKLHSSCTRKDLESLKPDTALLLSLHNGSLVKGVIVTLSGGLQGEVSEDCFVESQNYHCLSRYFAPWNGIPEDPVTGSAHTVLGPFWSKLLGMTRLKCRQCSPRGGDLIVSVREDGRVDLAGKATTVIQGNISI